MPTIAEAVAKNQALTASGKKIVVESESTENPHVQPPTAPTSGLPIRGVFTPNQVLDTDFAATTQAMRGANLRSATFPPQPLPNTVVTKKTIPAATTTTTIVSSSSSPAPDTDFYQTVQQAGAATPQEGNLNFLAPITAADNSGNSSTDIAVPNVVGDSGSGGTAGLVPAPPSGSAAAGKFLKADGTFAVPPGTGGAANYQTVEQAGSAKPGQHNLNFLAPITAVNNAGNTSTDITVPNMVGDSGSGGTAGLVPAPPSGSAAAGKFLKADGTFAVPSGGALVLLEQHTASNSAELDFTTCISATYDEYVIELIGIVPVTNGAKIEIQFNTGSGYDTTSGHYAWNIMGFSNTGNGFVGSQSDASIQLASGGINTGVTASGSLSGTYKLAIPASLYPRLWGQVSFITDTGFPSEASIGGGAYLVTTTITAFRVLMNSGNISSGTVRVYGISH